MKEIEGERPDLRVIEGNPSINNHATEGHGTILPRNYEIIRRAKVIFFPGNEPDSSVSILDPRPVFRLVRDLFAVFRGGLSIDLEPIDTTAEDSQSINLAALNLKFNHSNTPGEDN